MKRSILTYPEPLLAQEAEPVTEITQKLKDLANDMVETMYESDGIGLAAPQVGELVRLITVDVTGPENRKQLFVLFNPMIVDECGEVESEEGCLSVPNFRSKVTRAGEVRVLGQGLDGKEVAIEAKGMLAICLQHEIDHLNGTLFIDRISNLKRTLYDRKVRKWLKKAENNSD